MKILYFLDGIGNAGGIQEQTIRWLKHFDKQNSLDILGYYAVDPNGKKLNTESSYIERVNELGGKVFLIDPFKKGYYSKCIKQTKDFFKKHHDYDIIEVHGSSKCYHILKYAKKYGIKVRIAHSHCTQFQTKNKIKIFIGNILKKKYAKLANAYFACSSEAGNWLFPKAIIKNNNVYIIKNALDINQFCYNETIREQARAELNIKNRKVILHVGRFTYQKNHDFLIDVFNELAKLDNNYYLLLLGNSVRGDSYFKDNVVKKIKDYGLADSVLLAGVQKDINKYMNASDVFVLPSHFEGLPVVAVEAQATGLTCLLSDTISPETKITSLLSFYSLNNSAKEWAQKINDLLQNAKHRQTPTKEFIDAGYEIVSNTQNLQDLYAKLIKEIKND